MKEKCGLQMKRTIISLAIWLCAFVAFAEGSESVMLPSDRNHWTDATESRIGKRIGFVFNDSVIMAPTINCRIESGGFTINSPDKALILKTYNILNEF